MSGNEASYPTPFSATPMTGTIMMWRSTNKMREPELATTLLSSAPDLGVPSSVRDVEGRVGPSHGLSPVQDGGYESALVRRVCGRHAAALVAIASLILDDLEVAGDVVSDAIAAMCVRSPTLDPDGEEARARLAASVYRRCLGRLAAGERFPGLIPLTDTAGAPSDRLAQLSLRHRAVVALVLFGKQDMPMAADTLGITEQDVLTDLTQAVELIRSTHAHS